MSVCILWADEKQALHDVPSVAIPDQTQSNSKMFTKPLVNLVKIKIGVRLYRYKSNVLKSEC